MRQVTPVVNIVQDFSDGIRLIKLLDHILEVRAPPQRRPLPHAEDLTGGAGALGDEPGEAEGARARLARSGRGEHDPAPVSLLSFD